MPLVRGEIGDRCQLPAKTCAEQSDGRQKRQRELEREDQRRDSEAQCRVEERQPELDAQKQLERAMPCDMVGKWGSTSSDVEQLVPVRRLNQSPSDRERGATAGVVSDLVGRHGLTLWHIAPLAPPPPVRQLNQLPPSPMSRETS